MIETFGYNGTVLGPVLRLREGRQVSIDIRNDTDVDDIVHRHGLYVPSEADGAMEEGSSMVERGGTQRYTFNGEAEQLFTGNRLAAAYRLTVAETHVRSASACSWEEV